MKRGVIVCLLGAGLMAGCGTLSGAGSVMANPFSHMKPDYSEVPVEAMKVLARRVEEVVVNADGEAVIQGEGNVSIDTPVIRQAIRTRALRHEMLAQFLDTGHVYESKNGLVEIERTRAYKQSGSSRDRDRNALLVLSENENRWQLYEGILKANNLSPRSLSAVQAVFHEARVAVLAPGQRYEDESGAIVSKGN